MGTMSQCVDMSANLAPVVMVQGCTSDAGKSLLVAALCRHFSDRGIRVAPFKAQNMSNNAAVCDDGEIGRAQELQAVAARVKPDVRMNPILLKPGSDTSSHVILMGQPHLELSQMAWRDRRSVTWPAVVSALRSLRETFELVIVEGAGSPAEINLRDADIVNMSVALEADALVYLVADIDRGGAFAHLLGTMNCLTEPERSLVGGFVLNKFRGDAALLHPAPQWLQEQTGVPVVGVVPWIHHRVPDEDRLIVHDDASRLDASHFVASDLLCKRIALVAYPWASNFDEFEGLAHLEGVKLDIIRNATDLHAYDAVVLPGSRNTVASLRWLRSVGLAGQISQAAHGGTALLGICGGMQMLGMTIGDPLQLESGGLVSGLGLLDIHTELIAEKTTREVVAVITDTAEHARGYEIHHGHTTSGPMVDEELADGLGWRQENVVGIYVHGLLDDNAYRRRFLQRIGVTAITHVDRMAVLEIELNRVTQAVASSGWFTEVELQLSNALEHLR
jgi:adenosylcobyric acid synthase